MGTINQAICKQCGKIFVYIDGGGNSFHLLRCDQCGREKSLPFSDIRSLHFQYLKGLQGAYGPETAEQNHYVRDSVDIEPISEEKYHQQVEKKLGKCICGGNYSFNAEVRCPQCRSLKIRRGDPEISFD